MAPIGDLVLMKMNITKTFQMMPKREGLMHTGSLGSRSIKW